MKFPIKDFFSKCDQIRRKLRIWSHLLKKSLTEKNFTFCAVIIYYFTTFTDYLIFYIHICFGFVRPQPLFEILNKDKIFMWQINNLIQSKA